jgi:CheY-like chemotaxis protein
MTRRPLLVLGAIVALGSGCAGTQPNSSEPLALQPIAAHPDPDLAVAGWRLPFECLELSERITASQTRLYDAVAGMFSTGRATDERRLRSLEARADELGCPVPGSPHTY